MSLQRPIRDLLEASFDAEDARRVEGRIHASRETYAITPTGSFGSAGPHRAFRGFALGAASATAILGALWLFTRVPEVPPLRLSAAPEAVAGILAAVEEERVLSLDDDSRITLTPGTQLDVIRNRDGEMVLAMGDGRATFDITPHGPRQWQIDTAWFVIDVLGTEFTIERSAQGATVSVDRGEVRVRGERVQGGLQRLGAGDSLTVSVSTASLPSDASGRRAARPDGDGRSTATADEVDGLEEEASASHARPSDIDRDSFVPPQTPPRWRLLAEEGAYEEAYAALRVHGIQRAVQAAQDADTLWLLADSARLSGHPAGAVAPLQHLMNGHADHERAGIAAFTLGRIQQESLDDPQGAIRSFERALTLGLDPFLAVSAETRIDELRNTQTRPYAIPRPLP